MLTNPTRNSRFPFKAALRESPTTYLAHKATRARVVVIFARTTRRSCGLNEDRVRIEEDDSVVAISNTATVTTTITAPPCYRARQYRGLVVARHMLKHRAAASEAGTDESSAGASGAGQYAGAFFNAVSAPFGSTVFFAFRVFSLVLLMPGDLQVRRRGGLHCRSFSHALTNGTNRLDFSRACAEWLPLSLSSARLPT